MKSLLILIVLITASTSYAACEITVYKKKSSAKTAYTKSGASISKSVIKKLSDQCKFTVKIMSERQQNAMTVVRLKQRLAKLQAK